MNSVIQKMQAQQGGSIEELREFHEAIGEILKHPDEYDILQQGTEFGNSSEQFAPGQQDRICRLGVSLVFKRRA